VVAAVKSRDLVLFAGAGISTEGRNVFPISLRNVLNAELAEDNHQVAPAESFAGVATAYEEAFGRGALIQSIRIRLDYANAYPNVYRDATKFHAELSTIPGFDTIFTTNWDTYFEDEAGALPITIPEDYAYWELPGRKVFKLHGSMTNLSTIVATKADYRRCFRRLKSGVIGSSLKHLLATRSALFVGFSFTDEDFNQIYQLLKKEMKEILPRSFIVTLDHRVTPETHPGATVLHTDATFFLTELKRRLVSDEAMLADERFDDVEVMRIVLGKLRQILQTSFPPTRYPLVIYAASYQDGLADAFDRMLAKRKTGTYSHGHDVARMADNYALAEKRALRKRQYYEASYIRGYWSGLLYLLLSDKERKDLPLYHLFGVDEDLKELSQYRRALRSAGGRHKASLAHAKRVTADLAEGLALHHPSFLSPALMADE
jgi:hypothetical protein